MLNLDVVESGAKKVDTEERWFALEGRRFGQYAEMPLKVKVRSGGEAWSRAWTRGAQDYSKDLSPGARRRFAESSANPLTMEADALVKANRSAIRGSGALLAVAACGPVVDDPSKPLSPKLAKIYGSETLSASAQAAYQRRPDGLYEIPVSSDPPEEFVATDDQVFRLLAFPDFVNQVANARRMLVEESAEVLEEELGN